MKNQFAYTRTFTNLIVVGALLLASAIPAILSRSTVNAEQITSRSIDMSSSEVSAADNVYTVSFEPATTGNIRAVIVDFCDSPLVGTVCNAPAGLDTNDATLGIYNESGVSAGFAVDATESTANKVVLKDAAGTSVTAGDPVSFDLGDGTAGDGIDNPSGLGTFYARVLTYAVATDADAYDSTITGVTNPPSTTVDSGGVALSTADQLQVNARVQEQLEFCVAAIDNTDITLETDCTAGQFAAPETTVDLGVIDSTGPTASPVATSNGGNDLTGGMIIRTNAVNGATISYYAEDDATGGAADYLGALRVPGADCVNEPGTSSTDQCFNSSDVGLDLTTAIEGFGARVNDIEDTASAAGGTTGNLTASANYNAATFAWDALGATREVASSATVLDYTILELQFGARTAATTPTGSYQVVSTYIATSTF